MELKILKCHGSSNNFILIDEYQQNLFSDQQRLTLSKFLCNRNSTLGADGILFYQNSQNADAKMRMFNPDGTEAEMCGNGLRCLGRYACEQLKKDTVAIETLKSISQVKKENNIYFGVETYQAELNNISLQASSLPILIDETRFIAQFLPISKQRTFTAVSMPNPHLVAIVDDIYDDELEQVGQLANKSVKLLPNGININFCKILDDDSIYVRTYERGVGLTASCGSGMLASTLVACLLKNIAFNKRIKVFNQGGLVYCQAIESLDKQYKVFLTGNATFAFTQLIEFKFSDFSNLIQYCDEIFVEEIQNYGGFIEFSKP
ncbi:MAG: diaminopimelate epimerase [Thiomargarita sp.]|nr:diaminopimelate epimerase [Thiomargarita sp.]